MRKDKMGRFLEWWKAPGRYWEDVPESGHAGAGNPGGERFRREETLRREAVCDAFEIPASGGAAFIVLSGALHRAGAESGEGLYTLLRME